MSISKFFKETLKVSQRNTRWSWGAIDSFNNIIYLKVWEHDIETINKRVCVAISIDQKQKKIEKVSNGLAERFQHIENIKNGSKGYGVICTAKNTQTVKKEIKYFDKNVLLEFGDIINKNGNVYAEILARVPVQHLTRKQTSYSMLVDDLRKVLSIKDKTSKELLINARVGQGVFRSNILKLWNHRCCVTKSQTLDVIRASHIKPWKDANDKERLDPYNGLPLIASLDALFDAGLISFKSSGEMITSSSLSESEKEIFGLHELFLTMQPHEKTISYLAYHRENVFKE